MADAAKAIQLTAHIWRNLWIRPHDRETLELAVLTYQSAIHQLIRQYRGIDQNPWTFDKHFRRFAEETEALSAYLDMGGTGDWVANRQIVMDSHDQVCVHCGSTERLEVDHIIPRALGGSSHLQNLQILCRKCNRAKGAKTMAEWVMTDNARTRKENP